MNDRELWFYDQGYAEAEKKHRLNLADKPYLIYWCPLCKCESEPEVRPPIDVGSRSIIPVGRCKSCGARLEYGSVSYREQLQIRSGAQKQPDFVNRVN